MDDDLRDFMDEINLITKCPNDSKLPTGQSTVDMERCQSLIYTKERGTNFNHGLTKVLIPNVYKIPTAMDNGLDHHLHMHGL